MSSWCAAIDICVVRASACSSGSPSGTKSCALLLLNCTICSDLSVDLKLRQTGGGDGLPNAAALFVWQLDVYMGKLGEFGFQNFIGPVKNQCATAAGSHPTKDQDVLEIVEVSVVSDGIAQVNADALPYIDRAFVSRFKLGLHKLQFISIDHILRHCDPGLWTKTENGLL